MTKQYTTKQSVLDEAQKILDRSLRDVILDDGMGVKLMRLSKRFIKK